MGLEFNTLKVHLPKQGAMLAPDHECKHPPEHSQEHANLFWCSLCGAILVKAYE